MAAAMLAVKLGSFVSEEAICSTKYRWNSGESIFLIEFLALSAFCFGFVRSSAAVAPDELTEVGVLPSITQRLEPEAASIFEG